VPWVATGTLPFALPAASVALSLGCCELLLSWALPAQYGSFKERWTMRYHALAILAASVAIGLALGKAL